ncbi:MAG: hypothetical protein KY475_15685 [Planctomycetes bacterium]|nr:hypothetical protein [Planctomycetota bacterium]
MAFTWYGNQSSADSCNFGPLAVVWPLLERMNLAGIIDRHFCRPIGKRSSLTATS